MNSSAYGELWAIVLAAGEGSRLLSITRQLHGEDRPKQFALLAGDGSPLQETVGRLSALVPPTRTIVVVPERYVELAEDQLERFRGVDVVGQPGKAGTGPGLLFPLARVLGRSPRAQVLVTPSDHHFRRPERFLAQVAPALDAARAVEAGVCLLGVPAEAPSTDFGWIVRGAPVGGARGAHHVERFVEKPPAASAATLFQAGALWNTFVLAAGASRLWSLAARHLRAQARLFEPYFGVMDTTREDATLRALFAALEPADFCRDVLARSEGLAAIAVEGSGWTDWGTPERLLGSLEGTPALRELKRRLAAGREREAAAARAMA